MIAALAARPLLVLSALSAPDENIPVEKGPEWGKAAPAGLLVILLLAVAVFFLVKNMNKQMRKVPDHFGDDLAPEPGDAVDAGDSGDAIDSGDDAGGVGSAATPVPARGRESGDVAQDGTQSTRPDRAQPDGSQPDGGVTR